MTGEARIGPDFLCIGMQKAGTQWLYDQLDSCSGVWMPPIKELNYFAGDFGKPSNTSKIEYLQSQAANPEVDLPSDVQAFYDVVSKFGPDGPPGDAEYLSMFDGKGKRLSGDISPIYATAERDVAEHAARILPEARVVLLIRHPVARFKSALSMHVRKQKIGEGKLRSWDSINYLLLRPRYVQRSFPSRTWTTWKDAFGEERCRYWFFDDIVDRPEQVRTEIAAFIGLKDPDFSIAADFNRKASRQKFDLAPSIEAQLYKHFAEEIRICREIFGSRTQDWKTAL